jgi:hypothetical protein
VTISDQVWEQLDPYAGRLSPRARRRVQAGVVALTLVAVAGTALWWVGLLNPRLSINDENFSAKTLGRERTFTLIIRLENHGPATEHIGSLGRSGPGLELTSTEVPAEIGAGARVEATLHYHVTDCSAVPRQDWPIPVRINRSWGSRTAWPAGPLIVAYTEDTDPDAVDAPDLPWQWSLADRVCREPEPTTYASSSNP